MREIRWHNWLGANESRRYRGGLRLESRPPHIRGFALETLERRLLLTLPAVVSMDRWAPPSAGTGAVEVAYLVTFNEPVTHVSSADFALATTDTAASALPLEVTGSGAVYTVKAVELEGIGQLRLDLVDDDSIRNSLNVPLGGIGPGNGDFQGQTYQLDPIAPVVLSINGTNPSNLNTGATSVTYTVTFSESVENVDATDFSVATTGTVLVAWPPSVAGSNGVYSVTISGISGSGSLRLNLVDDGSIKDLAGNRLVTPNAPASFASAVAYPSGLVPVYVTTDDLNKDGKPDSIATNFLDNNVGVRLGNGDGTFQGQTTYPTGTNPNWVAVSDVNGDNILDLVVANLGSDTVGVLLGNGDGTFQSQTPFGTGADPDSVAIADINDDGRPDLAVANFSGNNVGILLGNGDGTFQPQFTVATGTNPQSVRLADVNGDDAYDLVVINFDNSNVGILLGNGNGTFQSQVTYPTGWKPRSVAVGDVNGDLRPDLIVANSGDNNIGVLLGNGNGTFQDQMTKPVGMNPQSVAIADVNGDGKRDVIVANFSDNRAGVLLGNGNGTFQNQTTFVAGTSPQSVAVADLNLDSKPDILTSNFQSFDVSVLRGNSLGSFTGQIYTIETATHLTFETLPGVTRAGEAINAPVGIRVAARNQFGQVVIDDASTVTISLIGGTFAGGGTTAVAPVVNGIATFTNLVINAIGTYALQANDGTLTGALTPDFQVATATLARQLFYAGSLRYHVTNGMFPGYSDDNAIASDKVALLPGAGTATFANVSSFSGGITGVMIDLFGGSGSGSGSITSSDFAFRVGNNNSPHLWAAAPAPATVTVRTGAGISGSDRVELIWPAGQISKTWLEVTVGANSHTGLATADVFYFGNAKGDSGLGDTVFFALVNSVDETGARNNPQFLSNNIPITYIYDYNRDGLVNSADQLISRNNATNPSNVVKYISVWPPTDVVARKLFYSGSTRYNVTNGMFPGHSDDNAIAVDKVALLPGAGTATFANVSGYSAGITGVMVDLLGASGVGSITAADFTFKMGNNNAPDQWATAPSPASVLVRSGAGVSGSDRVELIWPASQIAKTWLEITVAANSHTRLTQPDVFYFGNAKGDSGQGDTATLALVNSVDALGARNNPKSLMNNIPITNIYDFNRDGNVNGADELVARNNSTNPSTVLRYLNIGFPPAAPEAEPLAAPSTATDEPSVEVPSNNDGGDLSAAIALTECQQRATSPTALRSLIGDRLYDAAPSFFTIPIAALERTEHDPLANLAEEIDCATLDLDELLDALLDANGRKL